MDRLTELEMFVRAVELGSITRAAEKLGLSDPSASRCLSSLEQRLGTRLLERTTRRLWLTDAGRSYYQRCTELLAELAEADAEAADSTKRPSGILSVTSSPSFGMMHLAPILPQFQRLYPNISVHLMAANHYQNVIDPGVDIAIRTRPFERDSSITVRKLARTRYLPVASPKYLKERGSPSEPKDLQDHPMLLYGFARGLQPFRFARGDRKETVRLNPAIQSTEGRVLCAAALAHGGILIQPMYTIYDDLRAGRLAPVLEGWKLDPMTINIAYHTRKHQPARIRIFVDFILKQFAERHYEQKWMK
ncbi:LysR family transcriptional regulator [Bradyrhizobium macuxiense]|uniref:LysR family transcriptional regulator n=1 Tax=Bradyrhizobium macuxiense TaxID=1755647 RepID=A0A560KWY1_9BRAD|nr:LysR family transcriptional regulator [Bradyrhizobium macuxiense]